MVIKISVEYQLPIVRPVFCNGHDTGTRFIVPCQRDSPETNVTDTGKFRLQMGKSTEKNKRKWLFGGRYSHSRYFCNET